MPDAEPHRRSAGVGVLRAAVRVYQLTLRPLLPPTCRFAPSCSAFALTALDVHGVRRGTVMALARILRCHPWSHGGWDPVPPRRP